MRKGLKELSSWPTYPQLYVNGELLGGCDIGEPAPDKPRPYSTLCSWGGDNTSRPVRAQAGLNPRVAQGLRTRGPHLAHRPHPPPPLWARTLLAAVLEMREAGELKAAVEEMMHRTT